MVTHICDMYVNTLVTQICARKALTLDRIWKGFCCHTESAPSASFVQNVVNVDLSPEQTSLCDKQLVSKQLDSYIY